MRADLILVMALGVLIAAAPAAAQTNFYRDAVIACYFNAYYQGDQTSSIGVAQACYTGSPFCIAWSYTTGQSFIIPCETEGASPGCSSDAGCSDGNPCTVDSCVGGTCVFDPAPKVGLLCNPADPCPLRTCSVGGECFLGSPSQGGPTLAEGVGCWPDQYPGSGPCHDIHGGPGCNKAGVQACVCKINPSCCTDGMGWHASCVKLHNEQCFLYCGDGVCSPSEDTWSCPADCPDPCGDGVCSGSEDVDNCRKDCAGAGSCCEPHSGPGCSDLTMQNCLCDQHSWCCASGWGGWTSQCISAMTAKGCDPTGVCAAP
jgi:hypothetical protein